MEIPSNLTLLHFQQKLNSPTILRKKSLQNFLGQKKIDPEIWSQKYPHRTDKLETVLKKSRRSRQILNLSQI